MHLIIKKSCWKKVIPLKVKQIRRLFLIFIFSMELMVWRKELMECMPL